MNLIDKMAENLKLEPEYINRIVSRSSFYYKNYTIPKRNGSLRRISQPSAELKTFQYWVLYNILLKLPVSTAAYAYKKGDSIKKHVTMHCNSCFILHTDIKNFFETIRFAHLKPILTLNKAFITDLGVDFDEALTSIKQICFKNDYLCIGTVSSPAISNIIMNSFDTVLIDFCKRHSYIYTRYADDIYLSSKTYIDPKCITFISEQLENNGFHINTDKTNFYSSKYRRKVTGLIITPDQQISIGIEKRNQIKKMIYNKLVHGTGDSNQILGYLSFLKDIEPHTYNNLIIKYSKYCKGDIITELMKVQN